MGIPQDRYQILAILQRDVLHQLRQLSYCFSHPSLIFRQLPPGGNKLLA